MNYKYMRIQGRERAWMTKYPKGVFGMCWRLVLDGVMSKSDAEVFRAVDAWFVENLPEPPQCKAQEQVITFFKVEAAEDMLAHLAPALRLLDKYQHPYDVVYTNTVGTVVYEDAWQVAVQVADGEMV